MANKYDDEQTGDDGSRHAVSPAFCLSCLSDGISALSRRCPHCGSPRLLAHAERNTLTLAHIDCDAFFATIEKRDDPSLAGKPVIIGGGRRGVVATACYIARLSGVRSAMPMFKALELCPDAVVVRPNMEKYAKAGREVRLLMLETTPLVEPVSIDEAFLELSGTERLHHASPAITLARLAVRIEAEIGITVSVGLSYAKFLAKIASDLDKPRGFSILGRADAVAFLKDKPLRILPGVGAAAANRLEQAGLTKVGHIAQRQPKELMALLGREGMRLHQLSLAIDPRTVSTLRETKSVSAETTLDVDLSRYEELEPILWRMCEKTAIRLKKQGFSGRTATLKLKTADFRLITRSRQLAEPTQLALKLFAPLKEMLQQACDGTRFRLIGAGLSDLHTPSEADHGDLADSGVKRLKAMDIAIDTLRAKFGTASVGLGIGLGVEQSTSLRSTPQRITPTNKQKPS